MLIRQERAPNQILCSKCLLSRVGRNMLLWRLCDMVFLTLNNFAWIVWISRRLPDSCCVVLCNATSEKDPDLSYRLLMSKTRTKRIPRRQFHLLTCVELLEANVAIRVHFHITRDRSFYLKDRSQLTSINY